MQLFTIHTLILLVLVLNGARLILATRPASKKVEKPSIIQRLGIGVHVVLSVFLALCLFLSLFSETNEPLLMFSLLFMVNGLLYYFTHRKFKRYVEEIEEWFFYQAPICFSKPGLL